MSQAAVEYRWQAYPARERPAAALWTVLIIGACGVAVWLLAQNPVAGTAASVLLIAALHRFFFPSRYCLNEDGVTAHYLLRRERCRWQNIRRIASDKHSIYLGRRIRPSRFDPFHGLHLCCGNQREVVVGEIRKRWECSRQPVHAENKSAPATDLVLTEARP